MFNSESPIQIRKVVNPVVLRVILATIVLGICFFKLFVSYRGLDQAVAMDQAQIARQVAQGHGFSTQFLRPLELKTEATVRAQEKEEGKKNLDLSAFRDTNHPPLNICALAVALKITGSDRFEARRMVANKSTIYGPDRVVAATSLLFFLTALVLLYLFLRQLFDETIAGTSVALMALSNLMLDYALSGLAQPLMLCCLIGSLHFLLKAVRQKEMVRTGAILLNLCLSFFFMALLCLSCWMGIWVALGLIIFCAIYFRPYGAMAIPGMVIITLALAGSLINNSDVTGGLAGNAYYALYNGFGSGEDLVQRATSATSIPLNDANILLRLLGYTFDQLSVMYVAMGSIVVTPFFFLCLLNRYKRSGTEAIKWALLCLWLSACIGMALYGINTPLNASQLSPLFAPFFAAYGLSLTFNLLARMKLGTRFGVAQGISIGVIVLASAGSFIINLPKDIHRGIWLSNLAHPPYPPYYPAALNAKDETGKEVSLADKSNPQDVIVTDQPWAVAWYANRKAMWMPRRVDDYVNELEPIITRSGCQVQGFLITPSSHSPNHTTAVASRPGGMKGIMSENGDFAPLVMEGSVLLLMPKHNLALADHFISADPKRKTARPLGTIVSSGGQFPYRHFILGTDIIYYSRQPAN